MATMRWISTTEDAPWRTMMPRPVATAREAGLEVTDRRAQPWEGFGGCFNELGWIALGLLPAAERRRVLRALFHPAEGCRFSLCRLPIGASDYAAEWYSHDEHDGDFAMRKFSIERDRKFLLPYVKAAQALRPDLGFFASPWSPPTWMKFPRAYNHGRFIQDKEHLDAYARYLVKFVRAYAAEGVRIGQVHPQNEPVADQKFPSCVWTGEELRDFIRDHLGPALARSVPGCEVWLGTLNTDDYDGYPLTVLSDPGANRFVAGVAFQWAGKGAIQRTRAAWPDKRLMQSENECGDGANSWAHAEHVFRLMQHYLANGANAYVYWNMVLEEGGRSTWGWPQNSLVTVDPRTRRASFRHEYHVMRHLSGFVDPGAHRLELAGPWSGNAVAFANPDGHRVVAVHNPSPGERRFALRDRRAALEAVLPPRSVNTFVVG